MSVARALYDFDGDAASGELSFRAGDMIDITRQDIGEGWWEGSVNGGNPGLLPESYVELSGPPAAAAAPAPAPVEASSWAQPAAAIPQQNLPAEADDDGDFSEGEEDDGWDEDEGSEDDEPSRLDSGTMQSRSEIGAYAGSGGSENFGRSGTMKKSRRLRASAFVKAGAQDFMIGANQVTVADGDRILVEATKGQGPGWRWPENDPGLGDALVKVSLGGKKKSGFSSHQVYNITCGPFVVERRSKHFVWLHDRLTAKYTCICVPPMPDKSYSAKFGEDSETKRQQKLEKWIQRVMLHPVLRQDKFALKHFLTTPYAQDARWKKFKKSAEQDKMVGANFFPMVASSIPCPADAMKTINTFHEFHKEMKRAVNDCMSISQSHSNRMAGAIRKEYMTIAKGYNGLADVCKTANVNDGNAIKLSMAFFRAADTMNGCAELCKQQPANDELPWIDGMKEYHGLLSQFGEALTSSKEAHRKFEDIEKQDVSTVQPKEKAALRERLDRIHTVTLCEIHHFHESLKKDMKAYMQAYLQAQIEYHQRMITQMTAAKNEFDNLPF